MPVLCFGQEAVQTTMQQSADTVEQQNKIQQIKANIRERIDAKLSEPYDTTRNSGYWWRALKHGKVNFNDSTMGYPKFLKFCYKTYVWGDRAFNSYDSAYVVGTGKNWKLILKSENWIDRYIGKPTKDIKMIMGSNLVSNIGVSLSFMAVSVGYSFSLTGGGKSSKKADFSFTCARFTADAYYWENRNDMNVIYKHDNSDKGRQKMRQSGLERKAMGLTAYYFFNNRRYAQAAAYCYSKYQKRSAGSWLAGISLQHYDVKFNIDQLPEQAQSYIPDPSAAPRILYNDYCLLVGYGHNWVLGRKWLFNLTLTPYLGYRYNILEENPGAFSLNLRGRMGLVYNHKQFFAGLQGYSDHHRYKNNNSHLFNTYMTFSILGGIRF
jgi:hypothetical protein